MSRNTPIVYLVMGVAFSTLSCFRAIADDAEADKAKLSRALTFHASFDKGLDADFSRGDKKCYVQQGPTLVPAKANDQVKVVPDAGRYGGALHFPKKGTYRPSFKDD